MRYFSERETGDSPRETEDISVNVWRGVLTVVRNRAADGSFGAKFPVICEDGVLYLVPIWACSRMLYRPRYRSLLSLLSRAIRALGGQS